MKRRIRKVIKSIDKARSGGLVVSLPDMAEVEDLWEELWGGTGHYPYMSLSKMIEDLREEVV